MIVKDEAERLAGAVESARPIVDEIIILDTGSSDGSVELAKRLGAKVFAYDWKDDFAAARNEAIKKAETDWILSLDADEKISSRDHGRILELTENELIGGYYLIQRHYLPGEGYDDWRAVSGEYPEMERGFSGYTQNWALRLFRRNEAIVWDGRIHETVICVNPSLHWMTAKTNIVVHHYGKVAPAELLERKKRKYYRITRRKAEERPGDAKAQHEMGVQLHELGKWEECVPYFKRAFELDHSFTKALYFAGNALYKLGRMEQARGLLEQAVKKAPEDCDSLVCLAAVERAEGNDEAALALFDAAIGVREDFFSAWFNKGALLLSIGRYSEAEPCFQRALELMPDYPPAAFGLWQSRLFAGRFHLAGREMLQWLQQLPEIRKEVSEAAEAFLQRRDFALVERAFDPLAEAVNHPIVHAALGAAKLAAGKVDEAEKHLSRALELDDGRNDARVNLAQLKEAYRGDRSSAIELYEEALRREPENELCGARLAALRAAG